MKINILIISIYYPPITSIASNRIHSFAKYLDKEKYNVYVHTLDDGKKSSKGIAGVFVTRSRNDKMFKPFQFRKRTNKIVHYAKVIYNIMLKRLQKDVYQGWIEESISQLSPVVEKNKIDIVLSSFSPASTHKVALALKKKYPTLKWIADMRDEMSASPFIDKKTKIDYQSIEQQIFKYADAITSVSKPIIEEYKEMSKGSKLSFKEIRNGYDFELKEGQGSNEVFTLSYVGNFYGTRNPDYFLKALSELLATKYIKDIRIRFIGVKTHFDVPRNIMSHLSIIESVSHIRAIEEMRSSDALLLIHPNNGRKGIFTGKIFEYLATMRPIIALLDPQDVAAELIRKCNAGYISAFDNVKEIKEVITRVYDEWERGVKKEQNTEEIKKHHRKEQAKRLESFIQEVINE